MQDHGCTPPPSSAKRFLPCFSASSFHEDINHVQKNKGTTPCVPPRLPHVSKCPMGNDQSKTSVNLLYGVVRFLCHDVFIIVPLAVLSAGLSGFRRGARAKDGRFPHETTSSVKLQDTRCFAIMSVGAMVIVRVVSEHILSLPIEQ